MSYFIYSIYNLLYPNVWINDILELTLIIYFVTLILNTLEGETEVPNNSKKIFH